MKSPALAGLLFQGAIALPVCVLLMSIGLVYAYSYGLGASVFILPNAYFTHYAFRHVGARSVSRVVWSLQWGEYGKLVLVGVGFALLFRFVQPLSYLTAFSGFGSALVAHWIFAGWLQQRWVKPLQPRRQAHSEQESIKQTS